MPQEIYAQIVLLNDHSLHIVMSANDIVLCTAENLMLLLTDIESFKKTLFPLDQYTEDLVNPLCLPVNKIPGHEVAVIMENGTFVCKQPALFTCLFTAIKTKNLTDGLTINPASGLLQPMDAEQAKARAVTKTKRVVKAARLGRYKSMKTGTQFSRVSHKTPLPTDIDTFTQSANVDVTADSTQNAVETVSFVAAEASDIEGAAYTTKSNPTAGLVTVAEYARLNNRAKETVKDWIYKRKLKTAQLIDGKWYIDPNEVKKDGRSERRSNDVDGTGKKYYTFKGGSYEELQVYLLGRESFTPAVCPYIYTLEEAKYYEKHRYREVYWDRPCLVIDVNLDYKTGSGKTNRELILEGKSPVIPGDEEHRYHIHHVGRRSTTDPNTPFAIIPETDHNSKELYSVFHSAPEPMEDQHDDLFEEEKRKFWKRYLEESFRYHGYNNIPRLNRKRGGKKKPNDE